MSRVADLTCEALALDLHDTEMRAVNAEEDRAIYRMIAQEALGRCSDLHRTLERERRAHVHVREEFRSVVAELRHLRQATVVADPSDQTSDREVAL